MKYTMTFPNGRKQSPFNSEEVTRTLKQYGVSGLNPKKPPARLKQTGVHEFACRVGTISVEVKPQ